MKLNFFDKIDLITSLYKNSKHQWTDNNAQLCPREDMADFTFNESLCCCDLRLLLPHGLQKRCIAQKDEHDE